MNDNLGEKFITLKDYNSFTADQIVQYDKRKFIQIFWHFFLLRHSFVNAFIYCSILDPFHIRISKFFMNINLNFILNALLYSDNMIESRNLQSDTIYINVKQFF